MKNIVFLMLLSPTIAIATTLIFTPGQPMQAIIPTTNGYIMSEMGGKGNTFVQNVGNMEFIHRSDAPSTVIVNDGEGAGTPTPYNLIDMAGEE
jgi:hypothetical protein